MWMRTFKKFIILVTSSSPLKTTYLRQYLVSIVVHVASRVLHVLLGLVKVCVSTEYWLKPNQFKKSPLKKTTKRSSINTHSHTYTPSLFPPILVKDRNSKFSREIERNERAPNSRARQSEIQGLILKEAPEGTNLCRIRIRIRFWFRFQIRFFFFFQITKKSLNAVFTSVSDESSKDSVELSSISEIFDSIHTGEITQVRFNFNPTFDESSKESVELSSIPTLFYSILIIVFIVA